MYQFENNLLPEAFDSFSNLVANEHNHNTRAVTAGLHTIPTINTYHYGIMSIKNNCINDWNNFKRLFPHEINTSLSTHKIKTLFRNHVYRFY